MDIWGHQEILDLLEPVKPCKSSFEDFVTLLQNCLHDEGVFSPDKLSRVNVKLPHELMTFDIQEEMKQDARRTFFNDYNLMSRERYIFSDGDLHIIIDQEEDIFLADDYDRSGSRLHYYEHRTQHRLRVDRFDQAGREDILSARKPIAGSTLSDDIQYRSNYGLIIDLPDNLDILSKTSSDEDSYMKLLIEIIALYLKFSDRISRVRKLSYEERNTHLSRFKNGVVEDFLSLYSQYNPVEQKDSYEISRWRLNTINGPVIIKMNHALSHWYYRVYFAAKKFKRIGNLRFDRRFGLSSFKPEFFESDEAMVDVAELMLQYLHLLYIDIEKSVHLLEFTLGCEKSNLEPSENNSCL